MRMYILTKSYVRMLVLALFIMSKTGNNPNAHNFENGSGNCGRSLQWNTIKQ